VAYSEFIKSEAFMLYCQGISTRQIADIIKIRPGCDKISHSTIDSWAKSPDRTGLTWEDKKHEYLAIVEQTQKGVIVNQQKDIIQRTDEIKEKLLTEIDGENLSFKTKDAAIYSLLSILKYQDKIKDQKKRITVEEQVTLFIEAMSDIPEVNEVLSKYWDEIHKRFQEKARDLQRDKQHGRG